MNRNKVIILGDKNDNIDLIEKINMDSDVEFVNIGALSVLNEKAEVLSRLRNMHVNEEIAFLIVNVSGKDLEYSIKNTKEALKKIVELISDCSGIYFGLVLNKVEPSYVLMSDPEKLLKQVLFNFDIEKNTFKGKVLKRPIREIFYSESNRDKYSTEDEEIISIKRMQKIINIICDKN
jgi:hypothetical protein